MNLDTIVDLILENTPVWLIIPILLIIGLARYGPKFAKNWLDVINEFNSKNDSLKKEYIALIKSELEDKNRSLLKKDLELKELRRELEILRESKR